MCPKCPRWDSWDYPKEHARLASCVRNFVAKGLESVVVLT